MFYLSQETVIKQNILVAIPGCCVKMYLCSCTLSAPELRQ